MGNSLTTTPPAPTLAVVICTRDRPAALLETLESIWTQTRQPDELIIVDDGALADEVRGQIGDRCCALGISFRFSRNPAPGLTRARNHAAELASSDILLYLDDDVTCDRALIAETVCLMTDPRVDGATAIVEEPRFNSVSARLYQFMYRIAGWWRIAPRARPPGPPPAILAHREVAIRAQWLSGTIMALRRDIVRSHRFDEGLVGYALGEDREMSYRLAPRHWLLESRRARIVHRRDSAQRTDHRRFGFMSSRNYIYILRKTCRPGPGQWLLIGWSLCVLSAAHFVWAIFGNRVGHLSELRGMIEGVLKTLSKNSECGMRNAECRVRPLGGRNNSAPNLQSANRNPQSLRVLFVTNRLETGGAESMLVGLVKQLSSRGIQPVILCLRDAGPLAQTCRDAGIPVFGNLLRFKTDAGVISRIQQIIADQAIDVLVVAHSGGDRMFWSTIAAGLRNTPVVVWSHWFPRPGHRHFERANRALFRWVDAYVALGQGHRRALVRYEQVPAGRIVVIPNAIDLAPFMHSQSRGEIRRRLRLEDRHIAVGIIANLRPEKRHDIFIEAARRLSGKNSDLRFLVIGDGPYRDAVQAAAAASGLNHEVLRLLGPHDDVPELLSGLDLCCLCSEIEAFSVVMLEAAAAGCAFIGPAVGCLPEFVEHRASGLLIRPADAGTLADAVEELAGDETLRRALATEARNKVVREFGLERMADAFAGLLRRVAHTAGRRRGAVNPHHEPMVASQKSTAIAVRGS